MRAIFVSLILSSVWGTPLALQAQEDSASLENTVSSQEMENALQSVKKAAQEALDHIKALGTTMGNPSILREDQKTALNTLLQWQKRGETMLTQLGQPILSLEEKAKLTKQFLPDESVEKALAAIDEGVPSIAQKKQEISSAFQDFSTHVGIYNDHITLKNLHDAESGNPEASHKLLVQLLNEARSTFSAFSGTLASPSATTTEALKVVDAEIKRWEMLFKKTEEEKRDLSLKESLDLYRTANLNSALSLLGEAGGNKEKHDQFSEAVRHFFSFLEHHFGVKSKIEEDAHKEKINNPDLRENHETIVKILSDLDGSLKSIEDKAQNDPSLTEEHRQALEHLRETLKSHQTLVEDASKIGEPLSPLDAHILSGEGDGGEALHMALGLVPQEGAYSQLHQNLLSQYGLLMDSARTHSSLHEGLSLPLK